MKKTQVCREVADALHTAEESLEATLVHAREALARLTAAKVELGLNGTMGDGCIAQAAATVAALESARLDIYSAHKDAHAIMQMVGIRGVASTMLPPSECMPEEHRAA